MFEKLAFKNGCAHRFEIVTKDFRSIIPYMNNKLPQMNTLILSPNVDQTVEAGFPIEHRK